MSPELIVCYLRGDAPGEGRAVESHVKDCPECAIELLMARETLHGLRAPAAETIPFRPSVARRPETKSSWLPWAAAAAVLVFAVLFALNSSRSPLPSMVKSPKKAAPVPAPEEKKEAVAPTPQPRPQIVQQPEPPKPKPQPLPEPPAPLVKPEPPRPETPAPVVKPEPKPEEPRKPTMAERAVVARVTHAVGAPPATVGKVLRAGDTLATTRQEALAVAYDGVGTFYFRENSRVDFGAAGELTLHEGEMVANIDAGRRLAPLRTPAGALDLQSSLFSVQATKTSTELSFVEGRAGVGTSSTKGPATLVVRPGRLPETRALEAGFATWIPEKLASKKFSAWIETETSTAMQGFTAMVYEGSGERAAVQTAEQGYVGIKASLPFKAPQRVWLRVRQYPAKPVILAIVANGVRWPDRKLEDVPERQPWHWIGPIAINSDRLDLIVTALSRNPFRDGDERRSFPVVVDLVYVTTDLKLTPAERLPEVRHAYDLVLDEPTK